MKKHIFFLLIAIAVLSSSCSKDDDSTNLSGTEWKYALPQYEWEDEEYHLYKFISNTKYEFWIKYIDEPEAEKDWSGIYSISGNTITIDWGDDEISTGIIDGNTMSFSDGGEVEVFRKQ